MSRNSLITLGLFALLVLCLLCVTCHRSGIEEDLVSRTTDRLSEEGIGWAKVGASGRDLTLTGLAPSAALRQQALDTAGEVSGVRVVRDALELEEPMTTPYEMSASLKDGTLRIWGEVPSEAARAELVERATAVFGGERVVDDLTIRPGAAEAGWSDVATRGLTELGSLEEGELRLAQSRLTLRGRAPSVDVAERVRGELAAALPAGFSAEAMVSTAQVETEICQQLLDDLMRGNRIEFASNSARIEPASFDLLNRLAEAAADCPQARIEVAGHTDSIGPEELNQALSQSRAQAVVDYLTARGISSERLTSRGYGEARPIADNSTPGGRARNRRIEFKIH